MPRTTIDIDERTLRELKRKAVDEGRTLQSVANDLLKQGLQARRRHRFTLELKGWSGRVQPGVDLLDRDSLFDVMNGR